MPIPEEQLETWSHQGSVIQSSTTYARVKQALEAPDAKYAGENFEVFLQGSYCNDTNIYAESDVDVVIRLDSMFYYDVKSLNPIESRAFEAAYPGTVAYEYGTFKTDLVAALQKSFGPSTIKSGGKAIKIKADGNRRSADVVVAAQFRRYSSFPGIDGARMARGICFFTSSGDRVVNYPKQHSANCTAKHQATNGWFKPMVRIMKNMRSKLVDDGAIKDGTAPSYFVEGLLHNVPNDKFGGSYGDTFVAAINWIRQAEQTKLECASGHHYLVRDSVATCWPCEDFNWFINAAVELWNEWP